MVQTRGSTTEPVRRALFGLSRGRCYAPDCDEPVIVVEDGTPVFVAEVAHIVAALPTGPRGTASVNDRESFDNLLLLCGRHHKIIDNRATIDRYPVEVLRDWKNKREAELGPASLASLTALGDLVAYLPELLVDAFRDTTSELKQLVGRLEDLGQLSHDTARLLQVALARPTVEGPAVGDGLPGIKEAFEAAYDSAGGASFLGLPSAEAYPAGPGFVQHLRGARAGHPALICAIAGRPAVVITADLWNAIAQIGEGRPGTGVEGIGLPIHITGGDARYIGPEIDRVPTAGGAWQTGVMTRVSDDRWQWIPDLRFDPNTVTHADTSIDVNSCLDLRLRLAAEIPTIQDEPRLSAASRRRLAAALSDRATTDIISKLAAGRLPTLGAPRWEPRSEQFARNDSWGATYDCILPAPDGRAAIRGSAQILTPTQSRTAGLTSLVDVQIDFDGCQPFPCQPNTPVDHPLSHVELVEFFASAWQLAFDILPLAIDGAQSGVEPGSRPRVSLYVINERAQHRGSDRSFRLRDLVDLTPLGHTNKTHLSRLDIGIVGRGALPGVEARHVVHQALVRAAENAGYDAADLAEW